MDSKQVTAKSELNLARKWRSQSFDQIIGQELSVRILKNSLYKGHYFPVYLFSGQRGCGKTTTARVFAGALNCEQLASFQKKPQGVEIPCLHCQSCVAMQKNKHPDFIEIDAASHTGVDNIRTLIEGCSLLPLLGRKKIYLIDEVHMLSKAAFNALLKVLEEPPSHALFILATTDPQKIIDTVLSRCFQLFFKPIASKTLHTHLASVCTQENIGYTDAGLNCIIEQSEGSARDALNLLEQVRFASSKVTKESVLKLLGYIDDEHLIMLLSYLVQRNTIELLQLLKSISFTTSDARYVWNRLVDLVRTIVWIKFGVTPDQFMLYHQPLKQLAEQISVGRLRTMLQLFYDNEQLFLKTVNQHGLLEMLLLQLAAKASDGSTPSGAPLAAAPVYGEHVADDDEEYDDDEEGEDEEIEEEEEEIEEDDFKAEWRAFIAEIEMINDPLLYSIFQQGNPIKKDLSAQKVVVEFAENQQFFNKWIQETHDVWQHLLRDAVGVTAIEPQFSGAVVEKPKSELSGSTRSTAEPVTIKQSQPSAPPSYGFKKRFNSRATYEPPHGQKIDISDTKKWQKVHTVLRYFPGTVTHISEAG